MSVIVLPTWWLTSQSWGLGAVGLVKAWAWDVGPAPLLAGSVGQRSSTGCPDVREEDRDAASPWEECPRTRAVVNPSQVSRHGLMEGTVEIKLLKEAWICFLSDRCKLWTWLYRLLTA